MTDKAPPTFEEWEAQEATGQFVPNDDLAVLILPWAAKYHPEKYKKTLSVAGKPGPFRAYMLRLIEIRATEDRQWMRQVPLSVLDETSLELTIRFQGEILLVKGLKAEKPRDFAFWELSLSKEDFALLLASKRALDLTYD